MTECLLDSPTGGETKSGQVLLDVRSTGEYTGENTRGNARSGHMPGATHLEWLNFVTDDDIREFKPASELREMLGVAGVTPDKKITTY